jgi:hypothetical protein
MGTDERRNSVKERNGGRVGRSGEPDEELDRVDAALSHAAQHAHDPALGGRPSPGPVATPHLAVDTAGSSSTCRGRAPTRDWRTDLLHGETAPARELKDRRLAAALSWPISMSGIRSLAAAATALGPRTGAATPCRAWRGLRSTGSCSPRTSRASPVGPSAAQSALTARFGASASTVRSRRTARRASVWSGTTAERRAMRRLGTTCDPVPQSRPWSQVASRWQCNPVTA